MALVFTYVWPERAAGGMVQSLAAALRRMAELAGGSGDARASRAAAWQSLAEAQRLAGLSAFEPERSERVPPLIDLTRRVFLVQDALTQPAGTAVAGALAAVADRLDGRTAPGASPRQGGESGLSPALVGR